MQKSMMENVIQTIVIPFWRQRCKATREVETHHHETKLSQAERRVLDHFAASNNRAQDGIGVRASEADSRDWRELD
jgi:hypothetical protein